MKIIYISALISKGKMNNIIEHAKEKPLQSIQKFHRLICEGFVKNNMDVKTISAIPMSRKISKKIFWFEKCEVEKGVRYTYMPFINLKILRQICICIFTIIMVTGELLKNKKEKVFICDILNTTISNTTLMLSKIFNFKCIAIVTDLPRDLNTKKGKSINEIFQDRYDRYIILTEAMNEVVNTKNKPYIVIEAIADNDMKKSKNSIEHKCKKKICMYAGGLYEKYGVKNLIDAFCKIELKNIELHLYGSGELEDYIKNIQDEKIKYFGVVTNDEIIKNELNSILLINPRFTNYEYTKYSFPSKNIEYMSSGTPMLTTKLEGIPKEYYNYIYLFDDESIDGMKEKIEEILLKSDEELYDKGLKAKEFVLNKKNNVVQTKKIIKFLGE